jgi:hypothetical protein
MSSRSFHSLFMVASCAGAALGCYLVSLRVASERASLEDVEGRIVFAQRDLRVLQTEIGTRGRLSQLERWNAGAFALSAPSADQFLKGGFELARLVQPERKVDFQAPVVLASAPAPVLSRPPIGEPESDESGAPAAVAPSSLLHEASLKTETREVPARSVVTLPQTAAKSTDNPANAAKPAVKTLVEKLGLAAAHHPGKPDLKPASAAPKPIAKKSVDKPPLVTAKAMTKPVRLAKVDPLAPLLGKHSGNSRDSTTER